MPAKPRRNDSVWEAIVQRETGVRFYPYSDNMKATLAVELGMELKLANSLGPTDAPHVTSVFFAILCPTSEPMAGHHHFWNLLRGRSLLTSLPLHRALVVYGRFGLDTRSKLQWLLNTVVLPVVQPVYRGTVANFESSGSRSGLFRVRAGAFRGSSALTFVCSRNFGPSTL